MTNQQRNANQNYNKYHLTLVRITFIQKRQKTRHVTKNAEKREPLCTTGGNVNATTTMESSMKVPQKIKDRTTIWSKNSTSGYLPNRNKNTNLKRYLHSHVH